MMETAQVLCERRGGIAFVTLNRPEKRNAISPEMVVRLAQTWRTLATEDDIRAIVLTATGDAAFSSGFDLGSLIPLLADTRSPADEWDEQLLADKGQINAALLRTVDFFKPVVAAVNGLAIAGGTELLLAADIRIASSLATFGLAEVRRGIIPAGGSLTRLARQVSWAHAMELVLVGEPIDAEHALRIGLVNRVAPPAEVLNVATDFARRIALAGPFAVTKAKEVIVRSNGLPIEDAFAIESRCAREVGRSQDAQEGPRAFIERRTPNFVGR